MLKWLSAEGSAGAGAAEAEEVLSEYDSDAEDEADAGVGGAGAAQPRVVASASARRPRPALPGVVPGGEVTLFGEDGGAGMGGATGRRALSVCASPDGGLALAGGSDGVLRSLALSREGAAAVAASAATVADVGAPVTCVGFRPEARDAERSARGVAVAGTTAGEVCWVHVSSGKVLHRCALGAPGSAVHCLAHAPLEGSVLAAAGDDGCVYVVDEARKEVVEVLRGGNASRTTAGHTSRVAALCWADAAAADVLYSGGWDMTVQVWDRRAGPGSVRSLFGPYLCGDALDVRGPTLLTGSRRSESALQLWDLRADGAGPMAAESDALSAAGPTDVYAARFAGTDASRVLAGGGHGEVALLPAASAAAAAAAGARTWRFTHPDSLPCYALAVRPGPHPVALAAMGTRLALLPLA